MRAQRPIHGMRSTSAAGQADGDEGGGGYLHGVLVAAGAIE